MKQEISDLTLLERVQRLEKQTGIRSSLKEGNSVSDKLPQRIDDFLQDVSQYSNGKLTYTNIYKFSDIASKDDIKKLDNWRRLQMDNEVEDVSDVVIKFIKNKIK